MKDSGKKRAHIQRIGRKGRLGRKASRAKIQDGLHMAYKVRSPEEKKRGQKGKVWDATLVITETTPKRLNVSYS